MYGYLILKISSLILTNNFSYNFKILVLTNFNYHYINTKLIILMLHKNKVLFYKTSPKKLT